MKQAASLGSCGLFVKQGPLKAVASISDAYPRPEAAIPAFAGIAHHSYAASSSSSSAFWTGPESRPLASTSRSTNSITAMGEASDARMPALIDRKSVVKGKSVSVRVDLGGRRIIKKKNNTHHKLTHSPLAYKSVTRMIKLIT